MVNALVQVNVSGGTPVRNKENECRGSMVFECHSRQATPEELERYFGDKPKKQADETPKMKTISKDELLERLHPTHKEPEPQEPEPDEPEPLVLDGIVAAARKVEERKYKSMKAAVIAIGLVNGWE